MSANGDRCNNEQYRGNVISYVNAGIRRYGDNHWFWAIWIDVASPPADTWSGAVPTASGFCSSKREAHAAALTAMRSYVVESRDLGAYRRYWAWDYLTSTAAKERRGFFSRCKVGRNRWFWVAYAAGGWSPDKSPDARGIAESADAAVADAIKAIGPVEQCSNLTAENVRTKEAAILRSQQTTNRIDAAPLEFAFECHLDDSNYDGVSQDSITKHRIVKKTKRRIYADQEPYRENIKLSGEWWDYHQRSFVLDRAEFETTGKAKRGGCRWWNTYYADPSIYFAERQSMAWRPECFKQLELPNDASAEQIHEAYRKLAVKTHPDRGGDAEMFKRVRSWYEEALAFVGRRTQRT